MSNENKRKEFESMRAEFAKNLPDICQNCGRDDDLHIHHIVPLALGGNNVLSNLAVLCGECHGKIHGINIKESHGQAVKDGRRNAAKAGKWSCGKVPYGYDVDRDSNLVINEFEVSIIRLMFKWRYVDRMFTTQIKQILEEMAIPTKLDGAWSNSTLNRIFKNELYLGIYKLDGEIVGMLPDPILDEETIRAKFDFDAEYRVGNKYNRLSRSGREISFSHTTGGDSI